MNNQEVSTAYVGSTEIKEVRLGSQLVLAPNGDALWYKANALPSLDLRFAEDKSLVDATTGQNLVTFTRASEATFVNSQGQIQTAAINAPRFDHNPTTGESLGLLVEEARTNSITNNTMVGAMAGTPGTLPTNWSAGGGGLGTLTQQIVNVGTANGIHYLDYKISGTTSTTSLTLNFIGGAIAAALNGQSWTTSAYIALQAGSTTNVDAISLSVVERNSSGVELTSSSFDLKASITAALQRLSHTRVLNNASTAFVNSRILFNFASGVAIDITLRIGMPQLEQGAFATSVIPTTGTAATRSADVASISGSNFSSWYRQDEGTLYAEGKFAASGALGIAGVDDTTSSERWRLGHNGYGGGASSTAMVMVDGGAVQANFTSQENSWVSAITGRSAAAYAVNNLAMSTGGNTAVVDTSATIPTVTQMTVGQALGVTAPVNGTIRRLTFWPQRLGNEVLQRLTA